MEERQVTLRLHLTMDVAVLVKSDEDNISELAIETAQRILEEGNSVIGAGIIEAVKVDELS